jgi:hypothetical protein
MKSNVTGEKTYMNALVRCEIFRCGYIVWITNTYSQFLRVTYHRQE